MVIHPTAIIYPGVALGENVWVGAFAVVGSPGELRGEWSGEGMVSVGDGTVIRERTVIQGPARIGRDCYLMDGVHIAHDNQIGDRVTIAPHAAFAGHVTVEDDATIGIGVSVHQHRTIGRGAMVGMGAVVTKDIPAFETWVGNPARFHGVNEAKLHLAELECFD